MSISSLTAEMESMLYCRSAEQMFWNLEPIRGEHRGHVTGWRAVIGQQHSPGHHGLEPGLEDADGGDEAGGLFQPGAALLRQPHELAVSKLLLQASQAVDMMI